MFELVASVNCKAPEFAVILKSGLLSVSVNEIDGVVSLIAKSLHERSFEAVIFTAVRLLPIVVIPAIETPPCS